MNFVKNISFINKFQNLNNQDDLITFFRWIFNCSSNLSNCEQFSIINYYLSSKPFSFERKTFQIRVKVLHNDEVDAGFFSSDDIFNFRIEVFSPNYQSGMWLVIQICREHQLLLEILRSKISTDELWVHASSWSA